MDPTDFNKMDRLRFVAGEVQVVRGTAIASVDLAIPDSTNLVAGSQSNLYIKLTINDEMRALDNAVIRVAYDYTVSGRSLAPWILVTNPCIDNMCPCQRLNPNVPVYEKVGEGGPFEDGIHAGGVKKITMGHGDDNGLSFLWSLTVEYNDDSTPATIGEDGAQGSLSEVFTVAADDWITGITVIEDIGYPAANDIANRYTKALQFTTAQGTVSNDINVDSRIAATITIYTAPPGYMLGGVTALSGDIVENLGFYWVPRENISSTPISYGTSTNGDAFDHGHHGVGIQAVVMGFQTSAGAPSDLVAFDVSYRDGLETENIPIAVEMSTKTFESFAVSSFAVSVLSTKTFELQEGEYIAKITVWWRQAQIDDMVFETNTGRQSNFGNTGNLSK